jgi:glycolate oxidase iron-sulfur subunit
MSTPLPIFESTQSRDSTDPASAATSPLRLDPRTYDRALACVHCGLCMPACPTYLETGHEADGPRGRITLIQGLSDGKIPPSAAVRKHLDLCLDCRGCETACPSGVVYHELIEEMRARLGKYDAAKNSLRRNGSRGGASLPWDQRIIRSFSLNLFTRPRRLRAAMAPLRILQRLRVLEFFQRLRVFELLPASLAKMAQMLPEDGPIWPKDLPEHTGTGGMDAMMAALHNTAIAGRTPISNRSSAVPRATVGLLVGCIGRVLFDRLNRQTVQLLAAGGVDVFSPSAQSCCGAIHHHNGCPERAMQMARHNIDLFLPREGKGVEYIVANIAGCGAMLRDYDHLLRDDPVYSVRAREFSRRVRDISQLLCELPLPAMKCPVNLTATYHDACHLAHGQKITAEPRALLAKVPGLTMKPLAECDLCCGAAGTYNLQQPAMATALAERKLKNILATEAEVCITGNAGCSMQIQSQARAAGKSIRVMHPVEVVHRAMFGEEPKR